MRERKGEVVETQSAETCGMAGDCPETEKTERGALGSKGWHAAMCAARHVALSASKTTGGGR